MKIFFRTWLLLISFGLTPFLAQADDAYEICVYATNTPSDLLISFGTHHKTASYISSSDNPSFNIQSYYDSFGWGTTNDPSDTNNSSGAACVSQVWYGCGHYGGPEDPICPWGTDLAIDLESWLNGTMVPGQDNSIELLTETHDGSSFSATEVTTNVDATLSEHVADELMDPYVVSYNIDDGGDAGSDPLCDGTAAPTASDAQADASDNTSGNPAYQAMPRWFITEPYINLWVKDCPVFYTTSLGKTIGFQVAYKQHDTRPASGQTFVPPTGWSHNWFSYVHFVVPAYLSATNSSGPGQPLPSPRGPLAVDSNWRFTYDFSQWQANVYTTDGGQHDLDHDNYIDAKTGLTLLSVAGGFKLIHPDGTVDQYSTVTNLAFSFGMARSRGRYSDLGTKAPRLFNFGSMAYYSDTSGIYMKNTSGTNFIGEQVCYVSSDALLTSRTDPYGNTITLHYNSSAPYYLQSIVDYDGKTTTLSYSGGVLSGVSMPYGRSASFSSSDGQITSITDAQGMTSLFTYTNLPYTDIQFPFTDKTNASENIYMASMTTPYGTTAFSHSEAPPVFAINRPPALHRSLGSGGSVSWRLDAGPLASLYRGWFGATNLVNRAITVTLPDASHELYLYRRDSRGLVPTSYSTSFIPFYDYGQIDDGNDINGIDAPGSIDHFLSTRNSYHWNRQQYAHLSTANVNSLTSSDYLLATMKHWLGTGAYENIYPLMPEKNVSDQLSLMRSSSPDGITPGLLTWFAYSGQPSPWLAGDYSFVTSAVQLPDGGVRQKSTLMSGGSVNWISDSYTTEYGDVSTRYFSYAYDAGPVYGMPGYYYNRLNGFSPPSGDGLSFSYSSDGSEMDMNETGVGVTSYYYNTRHQITGIKHANGLTTTNYYDGNHFLTKSIDIESKATNTYTFANGLPATYTSPLGLQLSYSWDQLSRLIQVAYPDGTTIFNHYDRLDIVGHKDRLNHWTYASFDVMDQPFSFTNANGKVTYYSFCSCGALESITDPLFNSTAFSRDYDGNVYQMSSSDGFTVYYQRNILGQVTSVSNSAGLNLSYYYNNQGLVTNVSSPAGTVLAAVYDAGDRPVQITDAQGITTTNSFDALGRITSRQNAFGTVEQNFFSAQGIYLHYDALYHQTSYDYDPAGRVATITDGNYNTNGFTYNPLGQIATLADGNGHVTAWAYDIYGRMVGKTNGNNVLVETNGYDANGRLTAHWTPAKGLTHHTYDADGNRLTTAYSSGPGITATYDGLDRLLSLSDAVGVSAFTYQNFGAFQGALKTEDGPWAADTITHVYTNRLQQSLTLGQPAGSWAEYFGYDGLQRLHALNSPAGTFTYAYYGTGRNIQTLSLPGGNSIAESFGDAGELISTTLKHGATVLESQTYGYDANGSRTSVTRTDNSQATYGYDGIGQLTSAVGVEPDGTTVRANENFAYGYDAAGNLATRTDDTLVQTFGTDGANQLVSVLHNASLTFAGSLTNSPSLLKINGQSAAIYHDLTFAVAGGLALNDGLNSYTVVITSGVTMTNVFQKNLPAAVNLAYDLNGNLISDGLHLYDYDGANELARVTAPNVFKTEYAYDGFGRRRIRKDYVWGGAGWTQTNEVHYVYDGMTVIQERDGSNNPQVSYTRGTDLSGTMQGAGGIGGLLGRTDASGSAFYHADGNGNITMMINSSGVQMAKYLYDSFGNILGMWGTLATANTYRFSSKEMDVKSGLYYYGYRYYEPNLQRFLNNDPIQELGGINLYTYVGNDPINNIDPFGLAPNDDDEDLADRMLNRLDEGNYTQGGSRWTPQETQKAANDVKDAGEQGLMLATTPFTGGVGEIGELGEDANLAKNASKCKNLAKDAGEAAKGIAGKDLPGKGPNWTKLKGNQGWRDADKNIWKKDMKHKDHWDVSDQKGNKVKEIDYNGNQIWPDGPKNKNKW